MICLECKKEVKSINFKHLKSCSGITPTEYKIKYPNAELMDDSIKAKCARPGELNGCYVQDKHDKNEWIRICNCGRSIKHKSYVSYLKSLRIGTCAKCNTGNNWSGKTHTEETKRKMSDAHKGKIYTKSKLGTKEDPIVTKIRTATSKDRKNFLGKRHTDETRKVMREKRLIDIDNKFPLGWTSPNYNKTACKLFEEINQALGWNGRHAERIGEFRVIGYLVDFYEPTLNVVIEYDEKLHESPKRKAKDEKRQNEIIQELNCKFFRIKEGQEDSWPEILKSIIPF